jgi:hypothetical protein
MFNGVSTLIHPHHLHKCKRIGLQSRSETRTVNLVCAGIGNNVLVGGGAFTNRGIVSGTRVLQS